MPPFEVYQELIILLRMNNLRLRNITEKGANLFNYATNIRNCGSRTVVRYSLLTIMKFSMS